MLDTVLRTVPSVTHYTISTALSQGTHVIRIVQRSENHSNTAVFGGFYLADGKTLLPAPAKPQRKIEFIGDSHTAGYGNESPGRTCSLQRLREFTNANKSFSSLVTRTFRAQSVILGYSGKGMVRNYGDSNKKSEKPYPYYYDSTLGNVAGTWNFAQWVPDLVVICLGTNDFSTTPYQDDTSFITAYHSFINRVLCNYPSAWILCVSTHAGPLPHHIKHIVSAETTSIGHKKVFYAEYPQSLALTGCNWHPSLTDDRLIANTLIDTIMNTIGWDTATVHAIALSRYHAAGRVLRAIPLGTGGDYMISSSRTLAPGTRIEIHDLHGRMLARGNLDRNRSFYWKAGSFTSGCCIISVPETMLQEILPWFSIR